MAGCPLWMRGWLAICRSPVLYKSYLLLSGRFSRANYPNASHAFYLAGFQRSGNSYAKRLLATVFPGLSFSSHIHKVAAFRSAIRLHIPVIVLVRNPAQAVSSAIVQQIAKGHSPKRAYACIHEYIDYYTCLLEVLDQVHVVDAEMLGEPQSFIETVRGVVPGLPGVSEQDAVEASQKVIDGIQPHAASPHVYAWRSDEKEERKRKVLACLDGMPRFEEAKEVYSKVLNGSAHRPKPVVDTLL